MRNTTGNRRAGFTIVELLIVIVVIGILVAISIVAYQGIQNRSRDSIRTQAIADIRKALELYKVDHGQYPAQVGNHTGDYAGWEVSVDSGFMASLSDYMPNVPRDPVNDSTYYLAYARSTAGSQGCPASSGAFYVLRIVNLQQLDGREVSDMGACSSSTSTSPSRTPSQAQAVYFGFEG